MEREADAQDTGIQKPKSHNAEVSLHPKKINLGACWNQGPKNFWIHLKIEHGQKAPFRPKEYLIHPHPAQAGGLLSWYNISPARGTKSTPSASLSAKSRGLISAGSRYPRLMRSQVDFGSWEARVTRARHRSTPFS